jgi:hypothetical protein
MTIWYNIWFGIVCGPFGILFPFWYVLTKKNLATLVLFKDESNLALPNSILFLKPQSYFSQYSIICTLWQITHFSPFKIERFKVISFLSTNVHMYDSMQLNLFCTLEYFRIGAIKQWNLFRLETFPVKTAESMYTLFLLLLVWTAGGPALPQILRNG